MYNANELPTDVAIHANEESERVIARVRTERFPEAVKALLAGEGIWGAHRDKDGRVVVVAKDGEWIKTDIEVSPDGYAFA